MYAKFFKRFLDIFISLIIIIILFPLIIIISILIWYKIGFPIFIQKRPGLNNKVFKVYKFKTLLDNSEFEYDIKRQNPLGNFLRKTGLDELPQLINILQNKMSLIGPRPLLVEYLNKYSTYEKKRHLVKPGITGLAQVSKSDNGKKSWNKSIKLDVFYVYNVSFLLDVKIIWRTIKLIILRKKTYNDFIKPF
ncbi:sugar transferase [Candidatus Pelagibacter ubique]|nr:sugar transferase [Candidatus Pelagibacter ubique]